MKTKPINESAKKRYTKIWSVGAILYVKSIFLVSGWVGWDPPKAGLGLYISAFLPSFFTGWMIYGMIRYYFEEEDEFLRMLQVSSAIIATGLTLFVCSTLGFLTCYAQTKAFPLFMVYPMWCGFMGLATVFIYKKYR